MAEDATQTSAPVAEAPAPAEASTPAAPAPEAAPSQPDSQSFTAQIDSDIDDLWAKLEGREQPVAETPEPAPAKAEAPKQDTPKAEAPAPEIDRATIEREAEDRARAKIADEQRIEREAEQRVRAASEHKQAYEQYVGPEAEYRAVVSALEDAMAGDFAALDALDVMLPDGRKSSLVKGAKGLTQEEAVGIKRSWDMARRFEDLMGDRKVARLVDLWNAEVMAELSDPDIDTQAVIQHASPGKQIAELKRSLTERVTKRLTDQHTEVVKAKDAEISKLTERVNSLVNERGNLTAQRRASEAASPDRPGQPGALRGDLPSPEELAAMPADQAFQGGEIDRILRAIDGGLQSPRRRTA